MTSLLLADAGVGHDASSIPQVLLLLAAVMVGAKLAGEAAERLRLPPVVGELLLGVLIGNLRLFGGPDTAALGADPSLMLLAELGALLLLFQVGLESTPREMMAVGGRALLVAVVGVVTPMALAFALGEVMYPRESWLVHLFLGAMLTATSVGITARVLKDAGVVRTRFARIILGAAVIDDVLGLLVLAVVAGLIQGAASGTQMGAAGLAFIIAKAMAFLVGALVVGSYVTPRLFRSALALRSTGVVQSLSLGLCFALAWLAQQAGLAPIVGAYAAGLVLEEVHFEGQRERGERPLHETLAPLIAFLVPVFFARMGLLVDLRAFASLTVLQQALALTAVAIAGKLVCGLVVPRETGRLSVGLGMMPRGEVGLIFAALGTRLFVDGQPVIGPGTYAAAIFMVLMTTLLTPPLLLWSIRRERRSPPS
jgi:Kef-type K+ transport system membrane component KefB